MLELVKIEDSKLSELIGQKNAKQVIEFLKNKDN